MSALSLVDRGFVYATAHVRGGMEKGYAWYRQGRGAHKANSFSDFIAAAEKLIQDGYAAPDRIVAEGGSAGGLLMGAVANLAARAVGWHPLAVVPFVDVLNTMSDDTLPLTPPEWPEWGNPLQSEDDFRRIASYAPYEQVAAQDYPPILALAGLSDPRVTYWEPAKWVAKLRAVKTGQRPLYLKTHMEAGHQGASGRFDRLKETALSYAFALQLRGIGINVRNGAVGARPKGLYPSPMADIAGPRNPEIGAILMALDPSRRCPYATYDALGPYMSKETLEFHHDKHHQAYVTNANKLMEGKGLEVLELEDQVKEVFGKDPGLFNNLGQHVQPRAFLELDEAEWRRRCEPRCRAPCSSRSTATSAASTSSAPISSRPGRRSSARAGLGSASRMASCR